MIPGVPCIMSTHSLSHYQPYYIYYRTYIFTSIIYIIITITMTEGGRETGREREVLYILYIYIVSTGSHMVRVVVGI